MRGCRPLTDSEIESVTTYLSDPKFKREKALFILGIRTGLRLSSLLSLRIEDVSVQGKVRGRIRVRRASTKGRRSGYDQALHKQAVDALQRYLDERQRVAGYVFEGRSPKTRMHRSQGWRIIKEVYEKVGLEGGFGELGTHSLRKTFARLIYGVLEHDLVKTAYAMRHSSVSTTIKYLSFKEEEVDAAILAL
jgi:integrase